MGSSTRMWCNRSMASGDTDDACAGSLYSTCTHAANCIIHTSYRPQAPGPLGASFEHTPLDHLQRRHSKDMQSPQNFMQVCNAHTAMQS